MYARLTRLPFPSNRRSDVEDLWTSEPMKVIASQAGFRASVVLNSAEEDGACVAVTLWDEPTDFDNFYAGDHRDLNAPIRNSGMSVAAREGLELLALTLPTPGEVRIIRLQLDAGEAEAVLEFWTATGKGIVTAADGNLGAWALFDQDSLILELVFAWRDPEDGERFRLSPVHVSDFAPHLGARTHLVELRRLTMVA